MQDRTEQEQRVRESGLASWVIVRLTELTDGELRVAYTPRRVPSR
ncbi:MAG: hypothetical protein AAFP04_13910 [Myxococcota bacterium]